MMKRRKVVLGLKIFWFIVCFAILAFAFIQREIPDYVVAFGWMLMLVSFPIGYVVMVFTGFVYWVLHTQLNIETGHGFAQDFVLWALMVGAGYFQWFIGIPWIWRKIRNLKR